LWMSPNQIRENDMDHRSSPGGHLQDLYMNQPFCMKGSETEEL
jgi:hypothetical protein